MADRLEQLIGLLDSRLEGVTKRLNRNWTYQFLLSVLGLAHLEASELVNGIATLLHLGEIPPKLLTIALPVLLTYTFLTFGYYLSGFLELRKIYDKQFNKHFEPLQLSDREKKYASLKHTIFEVLYHTSNDRLAWYHYIPSVVYSLIIFGIVALNHAVTFSIIAVHAGCILKVVLFAGTVIVLTASYIQFWAAQQFRLMKWVTLCVYLASIAATIALIMKVT